MTQRKKKYFAPGISSPCNSCRCAKAIEDSLGGRLSASRKVPVKEHWVSFPCSSCELPGSSAIQLREHRRAFFGSSSSIDNSTCGRDLKQSRAAACNAQRLDYTAPACPC